MRRMGEHDIAAKDPLLMTEAEAYAYYAPDTAFVIDLSIIDTNTITIPNFAPKGAFGPFCPATILWGDGTSDTVFSSYWGQELSHTYEKAGVYVIRVPPCPDKSTWYGLWWGDSAPSNFRDAILRVLRWSDYSANSGFGYCTNLTEFPDGKLARWPDTKTSIGSVYNGCTGLTATELPDWPSGLTSIGSVYSGCTGLTATELPDWPSGLTSIGSVSNNMAGGVYADCKNIHITKVPEWPKALKAIRGNSGWNNDSVFYNVDIDVTELPEWPEGLEVIAGGVYNGCKNIRAKVPKWPSSLKSIIIAYYYSSPAVYDGCTGLYGEVPEWPEGLERLDSGVYTGCTGLTGEIPAWPTSLTSANYTYSGCTGLTGAPADWSNCTALTSIESVYNGCSKLTGEIPAFPPNVKNVNRAYQKCVGLYGDAPEWPDTVTTAHDTFWNTKVSGLIKKWGAAMVTATWTYENCKYLTGAWTDDPAELMPTNITSHDSCVSGASDALRALFYSDWGGTRTKEETTTT